jgi:hypothetical protein
MAIEVHDETIDDLLSSKVQSIQSIGSEPLPQHLLSTGEAAAEHSRLFQPIARDPLAGNDIFV